MLKILVTGGAGFIGTSYCNSLLLQKDEIELHVVDSLGYAASPANIKWKLNYFLHKLDISKIENLEEIFQANKFHRVIHFAAETHVDNSISNPLIFGSSNFIGTLNILEMCRKFSVQRLVHISTDEVFGSTTGDEKFLEDAAFNPSSPYAATKAGAELLVKAYSHTYGLDVVVARCSNNYGPNQNQEKLIPLAVTRLLKGLNVPIYGSGRQVREWIYVEDSVSAIEAVSKFGKAGESYNISSGEFKENVDVINEILSILNIEGNRIDWVEDRKGHDFKYALNSQKIRSELSWEPKTSFNEGLDETVNSIARRYYGQEV